MILIAQHMQYTKQFPHSPQDNISPRLFLSLAERLRSLANLALVVWFNKHSEGPLRQFLGRWWPGCVQPGPLQLLHTSLQRRYDDVIRVAEVFVQLHLRM